MLLILNFFSLEKQIAIGDLIFVQKVIPVGGTSCLFAKTFVPAKALLTRKTKKKKKYKFEVRTLEEYLTIKGD